MNSICKLTACICLVAAFSVANDSNDTVQAAAARADQAEVAAAQQTSQAHELARAGGASTNARAAVADAT